MRQVETQSPDNVKHVLNGFCRILSNKFQAKQYFTEKDCIVSGG